MPSFAVIPLRRYNRVDLFRHMGEPSAETPTSDRPSEDRLDSWKAIAAYLGRDVTTVQRWEKREAMPVHRHLHDKRGSVYALPQELDAWLKSRRKELGDEPDETDKDLKPGAPVEAEDAGSNYNATAVPDLAGSRGGCCHSACSLPLTLCPMAVHGMRSNPKSGLWQCCL